MAARKTEQNAGVTASKASHRPSIQDESIDRSLEKCFVLSNVIEREEVSCNEIVDEVENTQAEH
jgi:hypothetical protein